MDQTQEQMVLNFMKSSGHITSAIAFDMLGIIQLPKRIYNLKRQGYKIKTEWKQSKNRFGKKVHYCEYSLI